MENTVSRLNKKREERHKKKRVAFYQALESQEKGYEKNTATIKRLN